MYQETISTEKKALFKHLSFYLHEQRKWERAVVRRSLITLSLLSLTIAAFHEQKPVSSMAGICASSVGILSLKKANFYRRRATYRARQQKRALQNN